MELRAEAAACSRSSALGPRAAACSGGFHGPVPARPHGPSSFTVTVLERKRSKQTCGGREFLTWWIAVISIRQPRAHSDWWRLLLTDSLSDWVTRRTEDNLWPEEKLSPSAVCRSFLAERTECKHFGGEIFATWLLGVWLAPGLLSTRMKGAVPVLGIGSILHIVYLLCDFLLLHLGRGAQEGLMVSAQPKSPIRPNKKPHCGSFSGLHHCTFPGRGVVLAFLKVKSPHVTDPLISLPGIGGGGGLL